MSDRTPSANARPPLLPADETPMTHENDRLLRLPEVQQETGLGRSTIYRLISAGQFPPSVAIPGTSIVRWWESDIAAWKSRLPPPRRASERVSTDTTPGHFRDKSAA